MKPSILIVTELYPNVTNSFLGTFVVRQLRELQKSYDITVLTTHYIPLAKLFSVRQPHIRDDQGIQVVSIRYYPAWISIARLLQIVNDRQAAVINKRLTAKKILAAAKNLHQQTPFTLVHGHEIYIGDEAVPVGEALGIPSVFTLHGLYDYHLQGFGKHVMDLVLHNLRRIKNMIAVSKVAAQSYVKHGVRPEHLHIIPNGIIPQPIPPPDARVVEFAQNRLALLTVGFMTAEKRMDQVINALQHLQQNSVDAVLVIVGRGQLETELRAHVRQLDLEDYVLFLGEVKPADLSAVYAAADILVHPSVVDSFSMVCLEAMSFGKPVVCTSNIGITEYATNETDILVVPPDNQDALNAAVLSLATDPGKRQRIGTAALQTAQTLTAHTIAEKIHAVYEQLA